MRDLRNKDYYSPEEEIRKQQLNIPSLGLAVTNKDIYVYEILEGTGQVSRITRKKG